MLIYKTFFIERSNHASTQNDDKKLIENRLEVFSQQTDIVLKKQILPGKIWEAISQYFQQKRKNKQNDSFH